MSRDKINDLKPFISIIIMISTLFALVICKMEVRRMGYSVLKLSRVENVLRENQREKMLAFARFTGPERVRRIAQQRFILQPAELGQIIQMNGQRIAVRQ